MGESAEKPGGRGGGVSPEDGNTMAAEEGNEEEQKAVLYRLESEEGWRREAESDEAQEAEEGETGEGAGGKKGREGREGEGSICPRASMAEGEVTAARRWHPSQQARSKSVNAPMPLHAAIGR